MFILFSPKIFMRFSIFFHDLFMILSIVFFGGQIHRLIDNFFEKFTKRMIVFFHPYSCTLLLPLTQVQCEAVRAVYNTEGAPNKWTVQARVLQVRPVCQTVSLQCYIPPGG